MDLLDPVFLKHLQTWHKRISPEIWNEDELKADFISRFKAIETETSVEMVRIEARAVLNEWRLEYVQRNSSDAKLVDTTMKNKSVLELPSIPAVSTDTKMQEFGGAGAQSGPADQPGMKIMPSELSRLAMSDSRTYIASICMQAHKRCCCPL